MTITYDVHGNAEWRFYRKSYRKSRWRKEGQRMLDYLLKNYPGTSGIILVR